MPANLIISLPGCDAAAPGLLQIAKGPARCVNPMARSNGSIEVHRTIPCKGRKCTNRDREDFKRPRFPRYTRSTSLALPVRHKNQRLFLVSCRGRMSAMNQKFSLNVNGTAH